ncbi:MAG: sigma-54-dependent Fis family transcriptional regulator [Deltaproteobacteria bacterium]|nr:sigma-54-dependent Fis family transcriptional regulator [Deltaproteobacteria bacterium]
MKVQAPTYKIKVLFVDDEEGYRKSFNRAVRKDKTLLVETAADGKEALDKLRTFRADVVMTDVFMPNMDGLTLLKEIKAQYPEIFVLVITGQGTIENAVTAMKLGAYDYLLKPFDVEMASIVLKKIANHRNLLLESSAHEHEQGGAFRFENIIGQDQKMFRIYEMITQVARTNASVLIAGESGTGKELIAEAIHSKSPRRNKPFVQVNCGALTETLINSELFGYEKGAFTGATSQKRGHFEAADGGTILLDEIGDLPIQTQVALLRVLELGSFQRVGGTQTLKVDTRLICATNQDLSQRVDEKRFRQDLFYRINVVSIHVPPLRERRSDIPLLAKYFLGRYRKETQREITSISNSAMKRLTECNWPGNARELANIIQRAAVFCKGKEIRPEDLPEGIRSNRPSGGIALQLPSRSLHLAESTLIKRTLDETNWNFKQTAKALEIARGTLYSKMRKYQIERPC